MKFGISIFPTDLTLQPVEMARAVEERGFESLWLTEHSHIPVSRATPWGGKKGAPPLPDFYARIHDAFVALGAAAAVTTRIKLGTGITLVPQRDPIWLAKEVASLDVISGGRFILGIGYGWNKEEMASHSVAYTERRALMREKILLMKKLWTEEEASFDGEMLHLEQSWAWPKPVQKPHPPIIMGGDTGPKTIADMVEFCDGWMPNARHDLVGRLAAVRSALAAAGRDPATFEISAFSATPDKDKVDQLTDLGVSRAIFNVPPKSPSEVLTRLDQYAQFVSNL
ncbi:MAG: LLM class F420-dependent oxidoreductase [Acidimicrobiia bacterium]